MRLPRGVGRRGVRTHSSRHPDGDLELVLIFDLIDRSGPTWNAFRE
jgi:hypothetical protein